jgi:hypothetical protein
MDCVRRRGNSAAPALCAYAAADRRRNSSVPANHVAATIRGTSTHIEVDDGARGGLRGLVENEAPSKRA